MNNEVVFEGKNIHKAFGPTIALNDADLTIRKGEIRGLIGENGSGKSTIMAIASGMIQPTSGLMFYLGQSWQPKTMIEAQKAGIAMILQEANTIPNVMVAQNIFAGREKEFTKMGVIQMRRMIREANKKLNEFGITHIKGHEWINNYSFEDRKLIELVRCVHEDTRILVVDETTTALSLEGRNILYGVMRKLADAGQSVIFISHDLDEIMTQCDVVTVLRDGQITGHLNKEEMASLGAAKTIRYMMVGREIGEKYYREDYDSSHLGTVALKLESVTCGALKNFSLEVHHGEIVGIGGLSCCGMHLVGRIAYGIERPEKGQVLRDGVALENCLQAIEAGVGYISKNRDTEALILDASIQENISLPSLRSMEMLGFIHPKKQKALANQEITTFRIKCHGGKQLVKTLSGGNKQKVSFAKWTAKGSDVIIMDCPTRGVDVGVKQAMYSLIEDMKKEGKAILMISEELSELIGMVDRLHIMKNHAVTQTFMRSEQLKETDLIEYMI